MDTRNACICGLIAFAQHTVGIIIRPYETYRRIIRDGSGWELPYLAILLAIYFAVASVVKTAAFRPFLLTQEFIVLGSATGATYLVTVALLYRVAKFFGGDGSFGHVAIGWAYTLMPTLVWFLTTSLLYVIIPPPRTTSIAGIIFSSTFLIFSAALLFCKIILGYLVLRFGMRLKLGKIVVVLVVCLPLLALYSFGMFELGIFKIPFI
jgi:hypothetical protein